MMSTTLDLVPIGRACSETQSTLAEFRKAAGALRIVPPLRLSGIDHYERDDIERINERVQQDKSEGAA